MSERTIFDFGANLGENLPYYLKKCDRVVAVEANPELAARLRSRFSTEIAERRMFVIESAITSRLRSSEPAEFFVYRGRKPNGHVKSSLNPPEAGRESDFAPTKVSTVDIAQLVDRFGEPFFVKIDIEHHDFVVLDDLLGFGLRPQFLSVEAHDPRVVARLALVDDYLGFRLVSGRTVHEEFHDALIRTDVGLERWDFPAHSAGPFGDDLPGPWLDRAALFSVLGRTGFGWIDVHASTNNLGSPTPPSSVATYAQPQGVVEPLAIAMQLIFKATQRLPRALLRRIMGA